MNSYRTPWFYMVLPCFTTYQSLAETRMSLAKVSLDTL